MPTQSKAVTVRADTDAIELLKADHRNVERLFTEYEKLVEDEASYNEKEGLATTICAELTIHTQVEEEIFYPAARDILDEEDLVDEAVVEHATAKDLIAQLSEMSPDDDLYDAKIKVLSELVEHHVEEEEDEMFPKLKKAKLDTAALGPQMAERKRELVEELGIGAEVTEDRE
ncbi:MAG: hemerythrin domain-containing protein [Clostridia bacterium]|nr:hemerythrin domain-containing protein [Deltaproteobacteria bacterium]